MQYLAVQKDEFSRGRVHPPAGVMPRVTAVGLLPQGLTDPSTLRCVANRTREVRRSIAAQSKRRQSRSGLRVTDARRCISFECVGRPHRSVQRAITAMRRSHRPKQETGGAKKRTGRAHPSYKLRFAGALPPRRPDTVGSPFSRNPIFLSGIAIFGQMDRRSAGPRCGEPRP